MKKLLLALLAAASAHAAPVWLTDLDAAKAQGVKENKPVLVDFTGSDWCPPCKALHKDVFETVEFAEFASKYVLVELDYPRTKPQSFELKAKNREWQQKYAVNSFPTVLLIDAKSGDVFGKSVGFGGQSAKEYLAKLASFKNTPEGKAVFAREQAEVHFRESAKSRTVSDRINAAIEAKDRAAAEKAMLEGFADAPDHLKPMIPFNKARILLKIDPSAKAEALRLFDEAIAQASGNEKLTVLFKRYRDRTANSSAPVSGAK